MTKIEFETHDEDRIIFNKKITRRKFLKGSAAAAAITGASLATAGAEGTVLKALAKDEGSPAQAVEEQTFSGFCRGNDCHGCPFTITVRNGKFVKASPFLIKENSDMNRMCGKGHSHPLRTYGSERLKYPMKRVGDRGSGQWLRMTWDEAISEISTTWKSLIEKTGPESIAMCSGGGGALDACSVYPSRLQLALGASSINPDNDVANMWVTENSLIKGFWNGAFPGYWEKWNQPEDLYNAKYIFSIGLNPTEQMAVKHVYYIKAQQVYGANIIVIDPIYSIFASKANMYVPVRPGTDAAYLLAMGKIIVDEGLIDKPFMQQSTVAPFLVKESDGKYLRLSDLGKAEIGSAEDAIVVSDGLGNVDVPANISDPVITGTYTINGVKVTTAYDLLVERFNEWPTDRASEITGISAEKIIELAHMYAEGPSTFVTANGTDHYGNGQHALKAMVALSMITGQLGNKPGTGHNGSPTTIPLGVNAFANLWPPDGYIPPGPTFYLPYMVEAYSSKKNYGDYDVQKIKSMYICNANPLGGMAQPQAFLEMINNMDLVVVADVALCDTARYADIVLPAAGYFEQETVTIFYTPWISLNEKAIEPLYESKGDLEIANLLLTAMGHEGDVIPREQWIELAFNNDAAKSMNITYDRLKKEKYIYTHSLETDPKKAFRLGSTGTFHTDTGRAQFYFEALAPVTITGREWDFMLERLPYWKPPLEAWPKTIGDFPASPQGAKYPLVLINERDKFRVGTQFTYNPWLLELDPEPWTKINADDAAARGIKDGDYVKFYNDRGYYVSKAYISAAVMPGVVQVDRGYEKSQFKAGFHMDLESYKTDPVFVNQGHYDALIEMEKFTGSFERSGNFIEPAI